MKSERLYEAIGRVDEKWIALADQPIKLKKQERKHFILYELKKLLGVKYLWAFLAIFLALNSVVAWTTASKSANHMPHMMLADFFALYEREPEALDAYYQKLTLFNEEQQKLEIDALRNGEEYERETLPDVYSTDERYSDTLLFRTLYTAIEAAEGYPERLDKVIERAYSNLDEFYAMGIPTDSYAYRYQEKVIALYEIARDTVVLEPVYTRGWNEYFEYDTANVFLFLTLIMLASLIFTSEHQSGFLPVLRSTKNGRLRTAVAKCLTTIIVSTLFTLLFTLSTFAVFGIRLGYSSPSNAIQSLGEFALSPYLLDIGEYFVITTAIRILAATAFTLCVVFISILLGNHALVYLSGLGVFGLNLLLYMLPLRDSLAAAKHMNLLALSDGDPLFVRYRAVNLFGAVAGYVPFSLPLFGAISIALFALICTIYTRRGSSSARLAWLEAAISVVSGKLSDLKMRLSHLIVHREPSKRQRSYSLSLFAAECFKTLISSRFIFALIALLVVKVIYSSDLYAPDNSYFDAVYREYMTTLAGEVTDEKLEYLENERTMITETLAKLDQMRRLYADGDIDYEAYRDYMSDYHYAYSRSEILTVVENQARYLVKTEAETGTKVEFVYDTGWSKLFSSDADLFLYAAILLLLTGIFASEYTSKSSAGSFAQLLRSTKHGRETTFHAKLASAETIALVLALTMGAIDIVAILTGYEVSCAGAPLISMQMFEGIDSELTLGGFAVLFCAMRLLGALMLSLLVCALSELLCKYLPILGSTVALTMLPALCAAFGLAAAEKLSFLSLLAGTPLFLQAMRSDLLGGWPMLGLWVAVWAVVIGAILAPAKKLFVK